MHQKKTGGREGGLQHIKQKHQDIANYSEEHPTVSRERRVWGRFILLPFYIYVWQIVFIRHFWAEIRQMDSKMSENR